MSKYIDADVLRTQILEHKQKTPSGFERHNEIVQILGIIDRQPPADVCKCKIAEWIPDDYMYYRCSACGYEHDSSEYIITHCPNCGTLMERGLRG